MTRSILALALVACATGALAQQSNPFGGFKHDRTAPIEIAADSLEVREAEQIGVFTGDVVAGQGKLRLKAQTLTVWYGDGGGETGDIRRVRAEGDVFLSSDAETARGDWAEYNVEKGAIEMGGGVTLTQGENAISGQTLSIDLNQGRGKIGGGRVRSVFRPATKP